MKRIALIALALSGCHISKKDAKAEFVCENAGGVFPMKAVHGVNGRVMSYEGTDDNGLPLVVSKSNSSKWNCISRKDYVAALSKGLDNSIGACNRLESGKDKPDDYYLCHVKGNHLAEIAKRLN
jgi:hypothetical protein